MVGEGIAPPTATPEPDVRLSPHPAPQSEGHCQDIRRLVEEPTDSKDERWMPEPLARLATALSDLNIYWFPLLPSGRADVCISWALPQALASSAIPPLLSSG